MGSQHYCDLCYRYIKDRMGGEKGKDTNISRYRCSRCEATICIDCYNAGNGYCPFCHTQTLEKGT
jgi:hypothetical protein